jgi:large subunit ribosomal protein L6e
MSAKPQTKTFGKSSREVPASADKAKKWYNADDEPQAKDVSLLFLLFMFLVWYCVFLETERMGHWREVA